jgi:hypothetical protein
MAEGPWIVPRRMHHSTESLPLTGGRFSAFGEAKIGFDNA